MGPDADVLREVATLLRDFHAAMTSFNPEDGWSSELADPAGGPVLCHNDVCPENVVFRDGRAVALLDFDFAAPGRRAWDVARTARMWIPVGAPGDGLTWPGELDVHERLGVFTAAYGLDREELQTFVPTLLTAIHQGQDWVRGKVKAGEPSFVAMWQTLRLEERFRADAEWLIDHQRSLAESVSLPAIAPSTPDRLRQG